MLSRLLGWIGIYLALSVLAAVMLIAIAYPLHPSTREGWIWFGVLSLPALIAGALLQAFFLHNPVGKIVTARTKGTQISLLRMAYSFAFIIFLGGIAWAVAYSLGFMQ